MPIKVAPVIVIGTVFELFIMKSLLKWSGCKREYLVMAYFFLFRKKAGFSKTCFYEQVPTCFIRNVKSCADKFSGRC